MSLAGSREVVPFFSRFHIIVSFSSFLPSVFFFMSMSLQAGEKGEISRIKKVLFQTKDAFPLQPRRESRTRGGKLAVDRSR